VPDGVVRRELAKAGPQAAPVGAGACAN
jgi:hypothetical protein